MMAVEFNQDDITEVIDEVNGDVWPEELVPRKTREVCITYMYQFYRFLF